MNVWLRALWDRLRSSYWFIPTVMEIAAILLSLTGIEMDRRFRYDVLREQGWVYTGGAEGARAGLSTIAGSIITVAGTTFSIIIAALSLASAQFGPRLLRNFMRDTGNQVVLGTLTSTFIYCLLVLRTVRGLEDNTYWGNLCDGAVDRCFTVYAIRLTDHLSFCTQPCRPGSGGRLTRSTRSSGWVGLGVERLSCRLRLLQPYPRIARRA